MELKADPLVALGLEGEEVEEFVNQFFESVETVKVKNLSDEDMPDDMIFFLVWEQSFVQ